MDADPIQPAAIETGLGEAGDAAPRRVRPPTRSMARSEDGTEVLIEHHREAAEL